MGTLHLSVYGGALRAVREEAHTDMHRRMRGMHNRILKLILSFASSLSATYMQSYPLYQGSYIQLLEHPTPYNADMS